MKEYSKNRILKELNIASDKLLANAEKNTIDVNTIYGIFLPEYNHFIICKEHKKSYYKYPDLYEFFTGKYISNRCAGNSEVICPWRKGGEVYLDNEKKLEMAYSVPFKDLLEIFSLNGMTSEKNISLIYLIVNKHIRENTDFIEQLFNSEHEKNKMI